jgi:hypothetical protein
MHLLHFVSVLAFRPSMGEIAIQEQMDGMEGNGMITKISETRLF